MDRFSMRAAALAAALLAGAAATAAPVTFGALNDTATVTFADPGNAALGARLVWTLTGSDGRDLTFHVSVDNLSTVASGLRLTGFGIQTITPQASSASDGSASWDSSLDDEASLGGREVQFCSRFDAAASGSFVDCDSDRRTGLLAGQHSEFDVVMRFGRGYSLASAPVGLEGFVAKFALASSDDGYGRALRAAPGDITFSNLDTQVSTVPEPSSLVLFALGLLGTGVLRQRRAA